MPWLASIVHTADPFVVRITETFGVRWYGLAYAAGFLLGWAIMRWFAKTGRTPLSVAQVGDFATALVIGILVGGRVGHVVFYDPDLLVSFHSAFPFWGLLDLHRGGMSSHGGIIGVTVACWWCARRMGVPMLHLADLICFVAPLGLGLGRYANWINGELWGKPLPAAQQAAPPWWSVKYPAEVFEPGFWQVDSAAKFEALKQFARPGMELAQALYLACYSHNAKAIAALEPFLTARYPSNFFQAITDGVLLLVVVVLAWWSPRRPGFIAGAFLVGYGILRVLSEQFRVPDPDIFTVGPITLPMFLSAAMVLVGAIFIARTVRGDGPRFGGLVRRTGAV